MQYLCRKYHCKKKSGEASGEASTLSQLNTDLLLWFWAGDGLWVRVHHREKTGLGLCCAFNPHKFSGLDRFERGKKVRNQWLQIGIGDALGN